MSEDACGCFLRVVLVSPSHPYRPGTDLGPVAPPPSHCGPVSEVGTVSVCTRELEEVWPHGRHIYLVTAPLSPLGQR